MHALFKRSSQPRISGGGGGVAGSGGGWGQLHDRGNGALTAPSAALPLTPEPR